MKKNCILFLLIIGVFLSCSDVKHTTIDLKDVQTFEIQLDKMDLEDPPLYPKGCCVVDSFLVIFNPKDKDGFLSIYEGNNLLGKYGTIGEGSDDFMNPRFISNGKTVYTSRNIQIGDIHGIYTLNIDSVIARVAKSKLPCTEIPEDLYLYNYVLQNTDSMLVVQQTSDYQLSFYNKITSQTVGKNYFEGISSVRDASDFCYVMQIYDAYYMSNDDNFAIAYKYRKQIDILSSSGELEHRIYFPDYDYNDSKMSLKNRNLELSDDARFYFSLAAVDGENYYFLCWDDTKSNMRQGKAKTKIYKTDLDGRVQAIFQLDKSISYCCISHGYLYAAGLSEGEDMQIYYALLPESL